MELCRTFRRVSFDQSIRASIFFSLYIYLHGKTVTDEACVGGRRKKGRSNLVVINDTLVRLEYLQCGLTTQIEILELQRKMITGSSHTLQG